MAMGQTTARIGLRVHFTFSCSYSGIIRDSKFRSKKSSKANMSKVVISKVYSSCKPGMTPKEVTDYYNEWAEYDKQNTDELYRGPALTANAVYYHVLGRTDVSVLDVAAGTGMVGDQLKKLGFNTVDALEPSEGMLEAAKQKDLYQNYYHVFFTNNVDCIKSSQYDVLVCCAGMMDGHIPCDALKEMVRCVKKGGMIVIMMREEYLQTVAEYKDRLEPYMKQLETDGHWAIVDRTVIPEYFCHFNGMRYVFKVTKTEHGYN